MHNLHVYCDARSNDLNNRLNTLTHTATCNMQACTSVEEIMIDREFVL